MVMPNPMDMTTEQILAIPDELIGSVWLLGIAHSTPAQLAKATTSLREMFTAMCEHNANVSVDRLKKRTKTEQMPALFGAAFKRTLRLNEEDERTEPFTAQDLLDCYMMLDIARVTADALEER